MVELSICAEFTKMTENIKVKLDEMKYHRFNDYRYFTLLNWTHR